MNLTELAIRRPSAILVIFAILTFMGIASYSTLPIEMVPKFSPPVITIMTIYPGASPSEAENGVSRVIEEAISSVEGIDQMSVGSQENSSFLAVEFFQEVDLDKAAAEMQRKIDQIKSKLPKEALDPVVNKFALDELPIMRIAVFGNIAGTDFYDLVHKRIVPEISQTKGVAQVGLLGGEQREIKVNIHSKALRQYGISLVQVAQALRISNLDFPTGRVQDDEGQVRIRLAGKFTELDQVRNLIIGKSRFGGTVYVRDVADVVDGIKDREVIARTNRVPAIGLTVRKQGDANGVEMSDLVLEKLELLEKEYSDKGLQFQVVANSSKFTRMATDAVIHDLMIAVLLVSLVMLLFLHSLRNAIIVLVAIPTSIVSTFVMMKLFGYSLNLLSLLGLSLAIGILVDDAIVVIENIYRHLEMGKDRVTASLDGRKEIAFTAISITLVDVVVFLPIILSTGMVPDLMRQFCMTILTSTLMSLFVSFTLVPWLTSRLGKLHRFEGKNLGGKIVLAFERFLDWISDGIVSVLAWALKNGRTQVISLLTAGGLLASSFLLITEGYVGNSFFDPGERGEFLIELELPRSATLEQSDALTRQAEDWLHKQPEVINTYTTVGTNNKSFGLTKPNVAEVYVFLKPMGEEREEGTALYARKTKIALAEYLPGARVKSSPIDILGLSFSPIEIKLIGPELDSLLSLSDRVYSIMKNTAGCVEVSKTVEAGAPELRVDVDREKLANYGLTMIEVGLALQTAFNGNADTKFRSGDNEYPLRIQLDAFDRRNAKDIQNLSFVNPLGSTVYLRQFASVVEAAAPTRLERRDRMPSIMLVSQVIGRPNGSVSREIKGILDSLPLPPGAYIDYGGDLKRQEMGIGTMAFAIWVSLVLVYLIMVALYDNWVYPFSVLFSMPLAVIGAFLALALARENLTVFTGIGLIVLIGLVGKNAILVVDFANELRQKGRNLKEALLEATKLRFRPVLMTNISMVIGLLPIALASSAGADWKNGLAWAIIGGLNSSMFLSLIIVPVVYYLLDKLVDWLRTLIKSKKEKVVE